MKEGEKSQEEMNDSEEDSFASSDKKEEKDQKDEKDTITSVSASSGEESNGMFQDLSGRKIPAFNCFHFSDKSSEIFIIIISYNLKE